jgi:hypothetical protein
MASDHASFALPGKSGRARCTMKGADETVDGYIASLPDDRRETVKALRRLVLDNLPEGYVEAFNWGMVSYEVPLAVSGKTYNGKPLMYAAIGNQKNHIGLYLCGVYCIPDGRERLARSFAAAGKKLDMGKACLRLRTLDDIDVKAVAECIAAVPPQALVDASNAAPRKR